MVAEVMPEAKERDPSDSPAQVNKFYKGAEKHRLSKELTGQTPIKRNSVAQISQSNTQISLAFPVHIFSSSVYVLWTIAESLIDSFPSRGICIPQVPCS